MTKKNKDKTKRDYIYDSNEDVIATREETETAEGGHHETVMYNRPAEKEMSDGFEKTVMECIARKRHAKTNWSMGMFIGMDSKHRMYAATMDIDQHKAMEMANNVGFLIGKAPMTGLCESERYDLIGDVIGKLAIAFQEGMVDALPEEHYQYIEAAAGKKLEELHNGNND